MPHTNNPNAKARSARRHDPRKPKFLQRAGAKLSTVSKVVQTNGIPSDHTEEDVTNVPLSEIIQNIEPLNEREAKASLIKEFHALEKRLASTSDPLERRLILNRQKELGGINAYQAASMHGGDKKRGGESGKWCVQALKELKVGVEKDKDKGKGKEKEQPVILPDGTKQYPKVVREKLRILDIGAIAGTSYSDWNWLDVTSIDLNPQAPHVQKCDFFDYPIPEDKNRLFDVVGMSLVLNFVGSLRKRAEMLLRAHEFLKPSGLLYVVLPLPCLTNSRYMTHARFSSILETLGWKVVKQHDSAKLTYWLLRRDVAGEGENLKIEQEGEEGKVGQTSWKKEEVRTGVRRNNFCIIVNAVEEEEAEDTSIRSVTEEAGNQFEEEIADSSVDDDDEEPWTGIH